MKKLNKVAMIVATAFAVVAPMSSVFAQVATTAPGRIDNWRNVSGNRLEERHARTLLA